MPSLKKPPLDLLISILLIASTLYYAARYVDFSIPPFEDAAMLMRYSQNLAGGHGIVWNIAERPVAGATDFLFMAVYVVFIKLGLSLSWPCQIWTRTRPSVTSGQKLKQFFPG